jgi:hypothetical protein
VLEEKNKTLESQMKNAVAERVKALELEKVRALQNVQLQAQIAQNGVSVLVTLFKKIKKLCNRKHSCKSGEVRCAD